MHFFISKIYWNLHFGLTKKHKHFCPCKLCTVISWICIPPRWWRKVHTYLIQSNKNFEKVKYIRHIGLNYYIHAKYNTLEEVTKKNSKLHRVGWKGKLGVIKWQFSMYLKCFYCLGTIITFYFVIIRFIDTCSYDVFLYAIWS